MKMQYLLIAALFFVVLFAVGCGPAPTPEPTPTPEVHPGQALVASRCISCHDLSRVTNSRFDREGWQMTVDRMVISGAQLNDEQKAQVVDYLAQTYPKQ